MGNFRSQRCLLVIATICSWILDRRVLKMYTFSRNTTRALILIETWHMGQAIKSRQLQWVELPKIRHISSMYMKLLKAGPPSVLKALSLSFKFEAESTYKCWNTMHYSYVLTESRLSPTFLCLTRLTQRGRNPEWMAKFSFEVAQRCLITGQS